MTSSEKSNLVALTGCSGKIGRATLHALLKYSLLPPSQLVITTSSSPDAPSLAPYRDQGITIRQIDYNSRASQAAAFASCDRLLLVSNPRIEQDYAPGAPGREAAHFQTLGAAREAGVRFVYYTSLAFNSGSSKAGVMRAHNATERELERLQREEGLGYVALREGLYCESWPLYLGYWKLGRDEKEREEVVLADSGDVEVCWVSIEDLGLATAAVMASDTKEWDGRVVTLNATKGKSMREVARLVGERRGKEVKLKYVSADEHEKYYIEEKGMDKGAVKWWVSTYSAIKAGETLNSDRTLERILEHHGKGLKTMEETISDMIAGSV